jgi:alkylated DNA repair dioxygenase AlkB
LYDISTNMSIDKIILEMIDNLENDDIMALEQNNKKYLEKYLEKYGHDFLIKKSNTNPDPIIIPDANGIKGLWYIPNYLSKDELTMLKEKINTEIEFGPISKSANSRKVAHFGYYYSYDRTGLKPADPIPNFLKNLADIPRIKAIGVNFFNEFDQVIINEYSVGQQIAYHTDHVKLFGPVVACITIGQSVPINFKLGDIVKTVDVAEGSMYIMTGEARYKWQHSLKNIFNENRYSITYRTVNKN